jgi:hypothetical protein
VDFAAGNDANDGTSTNSPWRTIPGTQKLDGTANLNTSWGSFTTTARIPDNTTINIKCGTTHSSANGGFVWLASTSSGFYGNGYTNLVIQADTTWGTGTTATLDGTGMTIGIGLILMQIDGVTLRGLSIWNSPVGGIQAKEKAGNSEALTNLVFDGMTFFNNGTSYLTDLDGSGDGQLNIRKGYGVTISNCVLNGNNNFINGVLLGDDDKSVQGVVVDSTAYNHRGDPIDNDAGIGFKSLNGRLTFRNCISRENLKGFDLGEQRGLDAGSGGSPLDILYKVINCTSRSNRWGINFNGSADAYPGTITWYAINNLIADNGDTGMDTYAAPHQLFVVHNTFENNGALTTVWNGSHFSTTPNDTNDLAAIHTYLFNNVFRKQPGPAGTLLNKYHGPANDFTLTSDYNSYQQSGSEPFCVWSAYYGPPSATYNYGVNGPGHASGDWYTQYANSTTPPAKGIGHYRSDAHSKGTGADDPTLPPLDASYVPTNNYTGLNLSTQPWYIPEMGIDRAGRARTGWDIGMYEFSSGSPISLSATTLDFGTVLVGAVVTNQIVVQNVGGGTLAGTASVSAPFSIVAGGTYSLGAGLSQPVSIRYSPSATGTQSQIVAFAGASGASATVSGSGVTNVSAVVSAISQTGLDVDLNAPGLQIYAGSVIQYSGSASDPQGLPITWDWIYTVNGGSETILQSGNGNVSNTSFNYDTNEASKTYVWKLRVSNGFAVTESTLTVELRMPPSPTENLSFQADAGVITAPFTITNGSISQSMTSLDSSGGRAVYTFIITSAGRYYIEANVNAPGESSNSFFINNDAEPQAPTMIWDIPVTSGFEQRLVSWRGNGDAEVNEYVPKTFNFSQGIHQIIIAGCEMDTRLAGFSIIRVPAPPTNLKIVAAPQ